MYLHMVGFLAVIRVLVHGDEKRGAVRKSGLS